MSENNEDSFIILGDTSSLFDSYSLLQISQSNNKSLNGVDVDGESKINGSIEINNKQNNQVNSNSIQSNNSSQQRNSLQPSLAEGFLLGAIDCETMKTSIFNHFPSLITKYSKQEEVQKLQSLVVEHNELKDNLEKSNVAMRQQFTLLSSWHSDVKEMQENYKKKLNRLQLVNDELDAQNIKLKEQVDELQKIATNTQEQFSNVSSAVTKTNDEAKNQIKNLESQIEGLHLELSKAIGEKLELEDMRQSYIDELDCQKVNYVAAEELAKQSKAEALELKAENLTMKQEMRKLKKVMEEQEHELNLMRAQVDVYKTDFELERTARQEMAGDKEKLVQDIQSLQKRNQALIDNAASQPSSSAAKPPVKPKVTETSKTPESDSCPICGNVFKMNELERHVNDCLEKAQ